MTTSRPTFGWAVFYFAGLLNHDSFHSHISDFDHFFPADLGVSPEGMDVLGANSSVYPLRAHDQ